jgi:hypothetical protein
VAIPRASWGRGPKPMLLQGGQARTLKLWPPILLDQRLAFDPCRPATITTCVGREVQSLRRRPPPARARGSSPAGKNDYRPGVLSCLRQLLVLLDQEVATTLTSRPLSACGGPKNEELFTPAGDKVNQFVPTFNMLIFQHIASPAQARDAEQVQRYRDPPSQPPAAPSAGFAQFMKSGKAISASHSIKADKVFHSMVGQK